MFVFDGNNRIFADMLAQLPDGLVYFKESNVVPIMKEITFVEFFNDYSSGEDVEVYLDGELYTTVKVLSDRTIYAKIESPRSTIVFDVKDSSGNIRKVTETIGRRFLIKTKIRGKIFREEEYISQNLYSFFVMLSKAFNVDYQEIFKMFGNLYNKYLQDNLLYPKIGWFFGYSIPYGWSINDYRQTLTGPGYDITAQFINSMTISSVREIVKAFTGQYPDILSHRKVDGWILQDDNVIQNWAWPDYWLNGDILGTQNGVAGFNVDTLTFNFKIDTTTVNVTFSGTDPISIDDVITQINTAAGESIVEKRILSSTDARIQMLGKYIEILAGTSNSILGFTTADKAGVVEDADNKQIILYSGQFENFKVTMTVKNSLKQITEEAIRGFSTKDKLRHRWIDTVISITGITGSPTYVAGVDYQLVEDPIDSGEYYIEWLGGGSSPATNDRYLVIYKYYIKDELENIIEQVKPALVKINYEYVV